MENKIGRRDFLNGKYGVGTQLADYIIVIQFCDR
jgi:hypothetical protein